MMEAGSPIDASDGPGPMTRTCLTRAEHPEIRDTWYTFGLRGTGSHHVALTDVFVPDENFFEFPFGASFAPDPIFGKFPEVLVLSHGAVAVGIAEIDGRTGLHHHASAHDPLGVLAPAGKRA